MSWTEGAGEIRELLVRRALEQVEPSSQLAGRLVDEADRHVASAAVVLRDGDRTGAYQLAYDSLRKSGAALLAVQGLRATTRGGHVAVQQAMSAQFGDAFRSFGRIRRNRNRFEYPGDVTNEPDDDDVLDAIGVATKAATAARAILDGGTLGSWAD